MTRRADDIGRPFADVLRDRPDVIRVLAGAFELSHLPNRAELRLEGSRPRDRLHAVAGEGRRRATPIGAVHVFQGPDASVEQLEERERLRDRLASLGEMAAGIAHELKNPLAGIEVMAGLLRRQVPDSKDAAVAARRHPERSRSWPTRSSSRCSSSCGRSGCRSSTPTSRDVLQQSVTMAEIEGAARRAWRSTIEIEAEAADDRRRSSPARAQVFTNLLANAFEALDGKRRDRDHGRRRARSRRTRRLPASSRRRRRVIVDVADDGPGIAGGSDRQDFRSVFHHQAAGSGARPGHRSQDRRTPTTGASTSAACRAPARAFGSPLPVKSATDGSRSGRVGSMGRVGRTHEREASAERQRSSQVGEDDGPYSDC